jgi:uncharacterized Zn-binding protein involved in type VI secretion
MPGAARAQTRDRVFSLTGRGRKCAFPLRTTTGVVGSIKVFVNGSQAVKLGDLVGPHLRTGCVPDLSTLTTGSSKVFVEGLPMGKLGGRYTSDNIIIAASRNVFVGG